MLLCSVIISIQTASAQSNPVEDPEKKSACTLKPFSMLRAEENYAFVDYDACKHDLNARFKNVPLNRDASIFASFGGEVRLRAEHYENRLWQAGVDQDFWSHRIALNANVRIGENFRVFGELYHGYTSHMKEFAEYDELALHQGFVEYKSQLGQSDFSLRAGRQELAFGSGRLVSLREGPNIRSSFDTVKAQFANKYARTDIFYGREAISQFGVFDNSSNLFADAENNPALWGVYSRLSNTFLSNKADLYYLGFEANTARFNDVIGKETRHTLGVRLYDQKSDRFSYNTELMYQFGEIGGSDISAFNLETDLRYVVSHHGWKPALGLKLEWSSGDDAAGDGEINTYNPMFLNPSYYSLAKSTTPANVISIHPSIGFKPTPKLNVNLEWAKFWRESKSDGLYRVPRFFSRDGSLSQSDDIGQQIGLKVGYHINANWSADLEASYFWAGQFLEDTGASEDILHIAPTVRFKF